MTMRFSDLLELLLQLVDKLCFESLDLLEAL
jgi:hypothetical protein